MPPVISATRDDLLEQAKDRVSILDAARRLGLPELRMGVNKSPFREDRNPSFSVYRGPGGRTFFKDHALEDHKGSVWDFIKLAQPAMKPAEIRRWLLESAGLRDDPKAPRPSKSAMKAMSRAAEVARARAREAAKAEVPFVPAAPPWDKVVQDRYAEGVRHLATDAEYLTRVAGSRRWFDNVVEEQVEVGKMAAPMLPWGGRRGVAFLVERPVAAQGSAGRSLDLVPVGYHQRYTAQHRDGKRPKAWIYIPSIPKAQGADTTAFQRAMIGLGATIPAYPWVMGRLDRPHLVVVTEGQWDAISIHAAAGPELAHAAIFGIRGTSGTDVFLAAYGDWLKAVRPVVWLVADGDKAGRRWMTRQQPDLTQPPQPTFYDRLLALGASRVVATWPTGTGIKDFNDYYRANMPEPAKMRAWMVQLGLPIA